MAGDRKPPKQQVALILLERGSMFVHLDPNGGGVSVPSHCRKQSRLVLQVGLNLPRPIPDLVVDDAGFRATLSFDSGHFFCDVPWSAVFAMVGDDDRGMVWEESVPGDVAKEIAGQPIKTARPKLRLV